MSWDDGGGYGQGPKPPDPMEVLNDLKKRFSGKFAGGILTTAAAILLLIWAGTGFYIVGPDEVGVVKRFGEYSKTTQPGPHWHLPFPVESVEKPKVTRVQRLEIGFRTLSVGPPARYQRVPDEAHMLTGDENIVSCEFIVQFQIKDPVAYLFNVYDPTGFVRDAAEAAMREVVGRNKIDDVLTEAKDRIQFEARDLLQEIMDINNVGLRIHNVKLQDVYPPEQVIQAFRDVASAREDRDRIQKEAEAYANDILPRARGLAEKNLNEAVAYKETQVARAKGDVARFTKLLKEYSVAKEVTRQRLYLNTMAEVLEKTRVVVGDSKGTGTLPLLPLNATGERGN